MKDILKKWWFWVIVLAITIVLGITIIMVVALNLTTKGIHEVARKVQSIDSEATVYSSAGGNTIIIKMHSSSKEKIEELENLIKSYTGNNGILANYSKLIISTQLTIGSDELLVNNVYTLPEVKQDVENESIYINYIKNTNQSSKKITLKMYEQIKEGMTQEEVISILGKYDNKSDGENTYMLEWGNSYAPINDGYWIQIIFDVNNEKVSNKYQIGLK